MKALIAWLRGWRLRSLRAQASRLLVRYGPSPSHPEIRRWCRLSRQHEAIYRDMSALWQGIDDLAPLTFPARTAARGRWESGRRPAFILNWGVVTTVAVLLGSSYWGWQQWPLERQDLQTALGEQRTITLEDGTSIQLNTQTHLAVIRSRAGTRIQLETGEAAFTVAPQTQAFVVEAGHGEARVLGTRFTVRHESNAVTVAVMEGRVGVSSGPFLHRWLGEHAVLGPAQAARYDQPGRLSSAFAIDPAQATAWTQGRLLFDQTPLSEVIEDLRRYYHGNIQLKDPEIATLKLSGAYDLRNLEQFFGALPHVLPIRIERDANSQEITIRHN